MIMVIIMIMTMAIIRSISDFSLVLVLLLDIVCKLNWKILKII